MIQVIFNKRPVRASFGMARSIQIMPFRLTCPNLKNLVFKNPDTLSCKLLVSSPDLYPLIQITQARSPCINHFIRQYPQPNEA